MTSKPEMITLECAWCKRPLQDCICDDALTCGIDNPEYCEACD